MKYLMNKNGVFFKLNMEELNLKKENLVDLDCQFFNTEQELLNALNKMFPSAEIELESIEVDAFTLVLKENEYSLFSSSPSYIWDELVENDIYEFIACYQL